MVPNPRTWSIESIAAFHRARDDRRRRHALPAWDTLTDAQKVEANTTGKERADVLEGEIARLKTQAWSVSRYPILGAFPAPRDGWLVLPKAFNQRIEGSTKVSRTSHTISVVLTQAVQAKVSKGADLGLLVHAYCTERVDAAAQTTPNYVSSDSVHAVRFVSPLIL